MNKSAILAMILIVLSSGIAFAEDGNLGLGIIMGEPTGLSAKYKLDQTKAINAALAWSTGREANLQIHADYLIQMPGLFAISGKNVPFYYGGGAKVRVRDNANDILGIRVPLGFSYTFVQRPVELFLEIVPVLELIPGTAVNLDAGFGARYYF